MRLLLGRWAAAVRASPQLWRATAIPPTITASTSCRFASTPARRKNDRDFARLVPALEAFHASTGHWIVPYHFPIPSGTKRSLRNVTVVGKVSDVSEIDWPEDAIGMNLGRVLEKLMTNPTHRSDYPEVVDHLREIGFPVDDDWRATVWREKTMGALRTFFDIHGHTNVRIDFVVPRSDPWPVCTWGSRLGKLVDRLRRVYDTKLNDDELKDLQSVKFHSNAIDGEWVDIILPSLEVFAKQYGHCHVGIQFVVPSTSPWPERAWGYKLGSTVTMMRTAGTRANQAARDADRLNAIGFIWGSVVEHRWKEYVMPAFEAYAKINGSCEKIPIDFVVPSEAPWPEKTWGVRLRKLLDNIRVKGYYPNQIERYQQRLSELGVKWK